LNWLVFFVVQKFSSYLLVNGDHDKRRLQEVGFPSLSWMVSFYESPNMHFLLHTDGQKLIDSPFLLMCVARNPEVSVFRRDWVKDKMNKKWLKHLDLQWFQSKDHMMFSHLGCLILWDLEVHPLEVPNQGQLIETKECGYGPIAQERNHYSFK